MDLTALEQAPLATTPGGTPRNEEQRDDAAAVKTYRYLRLGMVVLVFALAISIGIQRWWAECWQGSISAYYYTPVRPIFVSVMVAIGVSLIVIKGSTRFEDWLLNVAGMLAPVVAFVPTSYEAACMPGQPLSPAALPPVEKAFVAVDVVRIMHDRRNNMLTLLVAGAAAVVLTVVLVVRERVIENRANRDYTPEQRAAKQTRQRYQLLQLAATTAVVGIGWVMYLNGAIFDFHGWAAVFMFVFLGTASAWNGIWLFRVNHDDDAASLVTNVRWKAFAVSYIVVGVAMFVLGVFIKFIWPDPWDHRTLVLEMTEIVLFVAMWVIQSIERWGKVLQYPSESPQPNLP